MPHTFAIDRKVPAEHQQSRANNPYEEIDWKRANAPVASVMIHTVAAAIDTLGWGDHLASVLDAGGRLTPADALDLLDRQDVVGFLGSEVQHVLEFAAEQNYDVLVRSTGLMTPSVSAWRANSGT